MTEPRTHRVHATPKPDGSELHLGGFVRQTVLDTIQLLAEHPALMDDLNAILGGHPAPDPYHPERHLPTEDLVERLTGLLPGTVRLHHEATAKLGGTLTEIADQQDRPGTVTPLPGQREGGAAA